MRSELENRIINFSVDVLEIAKSLEGNKIGKHLSDQLIRSGTSSALNYGEAQSGESKRDFIHKLKITLFVKSTLTAQKNS